MVAMSSQVVDVAWHEFILSTRALKSFEKKHSADFSIIRRRSHAADSERSGCYQADLAIGLCARGHSDPIRLPLLSALDADLKILNGFNIVWIVASRSHPYCGSHIGCSGGSCGTSDYGIKFHLPQCSWCRELRSQLWIEWWRR